MIDYAFYVRARPNTLQGACFSAMQPFTRVGFSTASPGARASADGRERFHQLFLCPIANLGME